MTHEEIIKAWFAIAQTNNTIHTSLHSCFHKTKVYIAKIEVGSAVSFIFGNEDIYEAMADTIENYSKWVCKNENK